MPMQTRAVVIPEANRVEIQTVTLRDPAPDDAVIETAYTSISAGTERMLLSGQMPHPMLQLPVVPGYETVGRVTAVGENAPDDLVGQWVYVGGAQCYDGINAAWGGQSERLHVPASRLIPLANIDPKHGVLLALAATSLHGIDVADPQPGQRVLVIGQGPVGQLAARLACLRDAWVAVSDINPQRLDRAQADVIVNPQATPLQEAITEPVDIIIEASGSMDALTAALPLLASGGTIVLLGYYQQLTLPYMPLFLKEARLLTAKEWGPNDLARCRDMLADGRLDVTPLLTHEQSVNDIAAVYDTAMNAPDCLKVVIAWG